LLHMAFCGYYRPRRRALQERSVVTPTPCDWVPEP